jgi:hypothetical protein
LSRRLHSADPAEGAELVDKGAVVGAAERNVAVVSVFGGELLVLGVDGRIVDVVLVAARAVALVRAAGVWLASPKGATLEFPCCVVIVILTIYIINIRLIFTCLQGRIEYDQNGCILGHVYALAGRVHRPVQQPPHERAARG